jgi:hypothetical protein
LDRDFRLALAELDFERVFGWLSGSLLGLC